MGKGLIGVAIEHYFSANNGTYLIEAADAFQLHGTGFRRRGDVVIKPGPAQAMTGDEGKALAAGCDDYLAKPIVDIDLVRTKMERWLTR